MVLKAPPTNNRTLELVGWLLFLLCAVVFVVAGIRDGDVLITIGSVLFLAACVLFLVPYLRR
jgi:hypothetical protein